MRNTTTETQYQAERMERRTLQKAGFKYNLFGKLIAPAKPTVKTIAKPVVKAAAKPVVPVVKASIPAVSLKLQRQRDTRKALMHKYGVDHE